MIYTIVIAFLLLNQSVVAGTFSSEEECKRQLPRWQLLYDRPGQATVTCEKQGA